jgi:hypothetical protein
MSKHVYYIKFGKANSIVKSQEGMTRFAFSDKEQETIVEGRIGNFWSFEEQLKEKLQQVGYKPGVFRKNVACVAVPISTSLNDMKNVFASFDQLGFSEIYTIFEPVALIHGLSRQSPDNLWRGIIDVGSSKVDISLINKHEMIRHYRFSLSKSRMERWIKDQNMTELLASIIAEEAQLAFEDAPPADFQVILTGGRMQHHEMRQKLLGAFHALYSTIIVENCDDLMVDGMENFWSKEKSRLTPLAHSIRSS